MVVITVYDQGVIALQLGCVFNEQCCLVKSVPNELCSKLLVMGFFDQLTMPVLESTSSYAIRASHHLYIVNHEGHKDVQFIDNCTPILPTILAPFDFLACNSNGGGRPQTHANRMEQMMAAGARIRVSFMIKFKRCSRRVFRTFICHEV